MGKRPQAHTADLRLITGPIRNHLNKDSYRQTHLTNTVDLKSISMDLRSILKSMQSRNEPRHVISNNVAF